jgi:hypothetical protein
MVSAGGRQLKPRLTAVALKVRRREHHRPLRRTVLPRAAAAVAHDRAVPQHGGALQNAALH